MNITNNKSIRSVLLVSEDLEYVQKLRKFLFWAGNESKG